MCGELVIRIEDFPDDDVIEAMELETPFDVLGLFHGQGLTEAGAVPETGQGPNMIWLYRRPILDYWAENDDNTLGEIVTHVLIHELGHHFGFSDEDMEAIEAAARLQSVSRAAEELHVTHGAVSRQLKVLEEHLGLSLFVKDGRGIKLTDAGVRLRDRLLRRRHARSHGRAPALSGARALRRRGRDDPARCAGENARGGGAA